MGGPGDDFKLNIFFVLFQRTFFFPVNLFFPSEKMTAMGDDFAIREDG